MTIDQLVIFLLSICIVLVVLWLLWKLVNWLVAPLQAGERRQIGKTNMTKGGSHSKTTTNPTTNPIGGRHSKPTTNPTTKTPPGFGSSTSTGRQPTGRVKTTKHKTGK
jgi:hypothetical protein